MLHSLPLKGDLGSSPKEALLQTAPEEPGSEVDLEHGIERFLEPKVLKDYKKKVLLGYTTTHRNSQQLCQHL